MLILIDADNGLDIETCASISRQLAAWIEEIDLIKEAYILEVSSPGLDFPLLGERMYRKNQGRGIKVITYDGQTLKGQLADVGPEGFVVVPESKKKLKKNEVGPAPIPVIYSDVKKAQVQVSFGNLPIEE